MTDAEFKIHLHGKLCEIADLIMYHADPCRIMEDGTCIGGRKQECCRHTVYDTQREDGKRCLFLTDRGCNTRTLGCKIWFCWPAFDRLNRKTKRLLKAIELIDRIYMLTTYLPDLYRPDRDEYDYRDVARYFDEDFH